MKEDGGQLQFSDVRNVVLQAMSGSESGITYRVAICTNDATLPLSFAYSGNGTGAERLATEIRSLLKMPTDTLVADSVAAMNESGRKIDAVLLQRDRR